MVSVIPKSFHLYRMTESRMCRPKCSNISMETVVKCGKSDGRCNMAVFSRREDTQYKE